MLEAIPKSIRKAIKENTKTLIQQSAILDYTDITDNDYPIEKNHKMIFFFSLI